MKQRGIMENVDLPAITDMTIRSTACRFALIATLTLIAYFALLTFFGSVYRLFSLDMDRLSNSRPKSHRLRISSFTMSCVVRTFTVHAVD